MGVSSRVGAAGWHQYRTDVLTAFGHIRSVRQGRRWLERIRPREMPIRRRSKPVGSKTDSRQLDHEAQLVVCTESLRLPVRGRRHPGGSSEKVVGLKGGPM